MNEHNEKASDYISEALKKLTEVVGDLKKELAELKEDYKSHGHGELVQKDKDYTPVKTCGWRTRER